mmetsp:Transcript_98152/g.194373  ORF Transcript_98152/g.194373 Transcript_98152/m.194373 type:complete len:196 (+) Transcript_98152:233-820(+)
MEAALHECTLMLEWPFGSDEVCASNGYRFLRLGSAGLATLAAQSRFDDIWEFVRNDVSHGLEPPTKEALAEGRAFILLAVQGRRVVGLVSAERLTPDQKLQCMPDEDSPGLALVEPGVHPHGIFQTAALGIFLIWVRRSERRKGLASAMVDVVRQVATLPGQVMASAGQVAFSQPTKLGFAFAKRYAGQALVYTP